MVRFLSKFWITANSYGRRKCNLQRLRTVLRSIISGSLHYPTSCSSACIYLRLGAAFLIALYNFLICFSVFNCSAVFLACPSFCAVLYVLLSNILLTDMWPSHNQISVVVDSTNDWYSLLRFHNFSGAYRHWLIVNASVIDNKAPLWGSPSRPKLCYCLSLTNEMMVFWILPAASWDNQILQGSRRALMFRGLHYGLQKLWTRFVIWSLQDCL